MISTFILIQLLCEEENGKERKYAREREDLKQCTQDIIN